MAAALGSGYAAAMPRLFVWPAGPALLTGGAIALLALPAWMEGPIVLPIGPGHALSVLDAVALVPLVGGALWLHAGLVVRRSRLGEAIRSAPASAGAMLFVTGVGLGLLLASAFSTFFWWWALGALLFALGNALLIMVIEKSTMPRVSRPRAPSDSERRKS